VRGAGQVGGQQRHIKNIKKYVKNILRETAWAPILHRRAHNNGPTRGYRRSPLSWSDQCAVPADLHMRAHATGRLWMLANGTYARGIYASAIHPTRHPYAPHFFAQETASTCKVPSARPKCVAQLLPAQNTRAVPQPAHGPRQGPTVPTSRSCTCTSQAPRAGTLARKPPHACERMHVRALADVDGKKQRRMRGKRAEVAEKLHEKAWPATAGSQGRGSGMRAHARGSSRDLKSRSPRATACRREKLSAGARESRQVREAPPRKVLGSKPRRRSQSRGSRRTRTTPCVLGAQRPSHGPAATRQDPAQLRNGAKEP